MLLPPPKTERYSLDKEVLPMAITFLVGGVIFTGLLIFLLCTIHAYDYSSFFIFFLCGMFAIGFLACSILMFRGHQSITINYRKKTIKVDRVYTADEISHLVYFAKDEKYIVPDVDNSLKLESGSTYCFGMVLKNDDYDNYEKVPLANVVCIDKDIDIAKMYNRSLTVSREFGLDFVDYINECLYQHGDLKETCNNPSITKSNMKKIVEKDQGVDKSKVYVYGDNWNITVRYYLPPTLKRSNISMISILFGLGVLSYLLFFNIQIIASISIAVIVGALCLFFVYLEYLNKRGSGWNRIVIKNDFLFYRNHEGKNSRTKLSDISTILNPSPNSHNLLLVEKGQKASYLACRHSVELQKLLHYVLHNHLLHP